MKTLDWIFRVGVAMMFSGHGWFAWQGKTGWIPYLTSVGIPLDWTSSLLPIIGILDQIIAVAVLFKFPKAITYWCIFWTVATALARPISGESWLEFMERGGNIAASLGLHFIWHHPELKHT